MFTVMHRYHGPEGEKARERRLVLEKIYYRAGSTFALNMAMEGINKELYRSVADVLAAEPGEAIRMTSRGPNSDEQTAGVMWYRKPLRGTEAGDILVSSECDAVRTYVVLSDGRSLELFRDARKAVLEYWQRRPVFGVA